ncbi:prepilin peptidase [Candidatus Woesearchaeota archaeon]|nr:prepilin peptidase [Candidatus Woesearchaeota archaeon]
MLDILLIIITIVWLIFASISDLKTREVPDWISFSLTIIAIAFLITQSISENNYRLLISPLIFGVIFTIIAFAMYYTKQWGGGDTKLLIPLGIIFATYPEKLLNYLNPNLNIQFSIIVLINIFVVGTIYSLLFSFYLAIKNKNNFLKEYKKNEFKKEKIIAIILAIVLAVIAIYLSYPKNILSLLLSLIILITPYLLAFVKSVEKSCMLEKISVRKLTEGDWIAENIYNNKKLVIGRNSLGITKEQINIIKKIRKEVLVKNGLPFIPSFLMAVIISLILGNIFFPF